MNYLTYIVIAEGIVASNFLRAAIGFGSKGKIYSSDQDDIAVVTDEEGVGMIQQSLQKNPDREKISPRLTVNQPMPRLTEFRLLPQGKIPKEQETLFS